MSLESDISFLARMQHLVLTGQATADEHARLRQLAERYDRTTGHRTDYVNELERRVANLENQVRKLRSQRG